MPKLELLEQYEALAPCDPKEMSYAWKTTMIVAYLVSSISSYICAALFFLFWHEVCNGHCLFWAEIEPKAERAEDIKVLKFVVGLKNEVKKLDSNWTQFVHVTYQQQRYCRWFHFHCLFSCFVAICLLVMFSLCGKGGRAQSLFDQPWKIVTPSLAISFLMVMLMLRVVHGFNHGLMTFVEDLYHFALDIMILRKDKYLYHVRPCEAFQTFVSAHNIHNYDSCLIFTIIQLSTATMAWSWAASSFILCLRIMSCADFTLLKIKIYKLPDKGSERDAILGKAYVEKRDRARRPSEAPWSQLKKVL